MAEATTPLNFLRITVALTALRHKPHQKSIAGLLIPGERLKLIAEDYVQELRVCFSSSQDTHAYWRKRAHDAELAVEELEAEIQRVHDKCAVIGDDSQVGVVPQTSNKPSQKEAGKRKNKTNVDAKGDLSQVWKDVVTFQNSSIAPQTLLRDLEIIDFIFKYDQVRIGPRPNTDLLPLLQRCTKAIAKTLANALSNPSRSNSHRTVEWISSLLPLLILRSLPLIPSGILQDDVEKLLLSELFSSIIRPAIRNLNQIGLARAQHQLGSHPLSEHWLPEFDLRKPLFELCRRILEVTRNRAGCSTTLLVMTATEASRELDRLCRGSEHQGCKDRLSISRIVLRDTIWYLGALIQTGLSVEVDPDTTSASNHFFKLSVVRSLSDLLSAQNGLGLEFDAMELRFLTKVLSEALSAMYEPDDEGEGLTL